MAYLAGAGSLPEGCYRSDQAGGGLGVDGVGLAGGAAQAPVASIHFRDTMPGVANGPRQAGAIAAGAFDAEGLDRRSLAERLDPCTNAPDYRLRAFRRLDKL